MKKVLLYSGGMDSWLIDKLWKPDVRLFFDIGTPNNKMELDNIMKNNIDVEIVQMDLSKFEQPNNNYFLPLRNLHFVVYAAHYGDEICLGATGSSTHKDKNDVFATLSENVVNYLLSEDESRIENVRIILPYRNTTKTELLSLYLNQGGDIQKAYNETFSCYSPINGKPCMQCTSCMSKFTAFYNNGYQFDPETTDRFIKTVNSGKVPCKEDTIQLAKKLDHNVKVICVDFDNTVTSKSKYPVTGIITEQCIKKLNELHDKGYYLILYTSRIAKDFSDAIEICKAHKLPFDKYISGKPNADFYIDDKALFFDSWENISI